MPNFETVHGKDKRNFEFKYIGSDIISCFNPTTERHQGMQRQTLHRSSLQMRWRSACTRTSGAYKCLGVLFNVLFHPIFLTSPHLLFSTQVVPVQRLGREAAADGSAAVVHR